MPVRLFTRRNALSESSDICRYDGRHWNQTFLSTSAAKQPLVVHPQYDLQVLPFIVGKVTTFGG